MGENHTTAAVQGNLDALAEETPAHPLIRALLDRAVGRLEMLCGNMLFRSYPRLRRPPLNLYTLSASEEREAFGLVRTQAPTHGEAAEVPGVSARAVQRRPNCSLVPLAKELDHPRPS